MKRVHEGLPRRGMVGMIMMVLILGFMMAVSFSSFTIVHSEKQGALAARGPDRALGAALAGVQYYMGVLNATDTTFAVGNERGRLHFLSDAANTAVGTPTNPLQEIATGSGAVAGGGTGFTTRVTSTWMFASGTSLIPTDPLVTDRASSSLFILKTFVDLGNLNHVYVKSLGAWREFDEEVPVATFVAQVLARVRVDPVRKVCRLEKLMEVPVEYPPVPGNAFHANRQDPWK